MLSKKSRYILLYLSIWIYLYYQIIDHNPYKVMKNPARALSIRKSRPSELTLNHTTLSTPPYVGRSEHVQRIIREALGKR
jgi:hypothetical protein